VIDSFVFTDENESSIKCLSVALWEIDTWYNNDEDPIVFILPEFVLNETWNVLQELEDMSFEIWIDQITEIIVDKIKYTFLY
jgi:hypothetical protein